MARIRTIKPEFPQSESMGRVSRDARLTFIMLWTIADDSGRLRGNSRMLASLLFPYDPDAGSLIDGWLNELDTEDCISRYMAGKDQYIQICNWLSHQKIDKPSKSKIPAFDESSRMFANPRECSSGDQGPRIEGPKEKDHNPPTPPEGEPKKERKRRTRTEILTPYPEKVRAVTNGVLRPGFWRTEDPDGRAIVADLSKLCSNLDLIFKDHPEITPEELVQDAARFLAKDRMRYPAPQWYFGSGQNGKLPHWLEERRMAVHLGSRQLLLAEVVNG